MSVFQKATEIAEYKKKKKTKNGFISQMKDELKKVSWTKKDELWGFGKIVVGSIFALGTGIYIFDLIIRSVFSSLENLVRFIGA